MIRVFIGYDSVLSLDHFVAQESIITNTSKPVSIVPISLSMLMGVKGFNRQPDALQSTAFAISRWLTPYLCNYEGWTLFLDSDIVMIDDVAKLWALRDEKYAVQVVKQEYVPIKDRKFDDHIQTHYDKKNWSSVMLFNNERCKALTVEYVNSAAGLDLHQFKWLQNDSEIGDLPARWNYLVGVGEPKNLSDISLLHYTVGSPLHSEYEFCDFSELWKYYFTQLTSKSPSKKFT